jgi:hypothetical protein
MVEDVTLVVAQAAEQHARLTEALREQDARDLGFIEAQARALEEQLTIEVVVCLDDVTIWSTETHKLRHLVALPDADQVPWVLSLPDLMVTTDLLQGSQLVHFLTRRQRLEAEGKVEAHDELDWVGNYIHDGLFLDGVFAGAEAPDFYRLLTYTEDIDSWYFSRAGVMKRPVEKPHQPLPNGMAALIQRLEHDRPSHWLIAAILLLNGDSESRALVDAFMNHTIERSAEVGWSNATQVFQDYGITFWVDGRLDARGLTRVMTAYAAAKTLDVGRPNWICLGLSKQSTLVVVVHETDPELPLARVLLRRSKLGAKPSES